MIRMVKNMRRTTSILAAMLCFSACDPFQVPSPYTLHSSTKGDSESQVYQPTAIDLAILTLLNDEQTTVDFLDGQVPLDLRAAQSLIVRRNGQDGVFGTEDDNLYGSMAEVDATYWVGEQTLTRLAAFVEWAGWLFDPSAVLGVYHGIAFTVAEGKDVVHWINTAPPYVLEQTNLQQEAINSVLKMRPFKTMSDLAHVYFVDHSAMMIVRAIVVERFSCPEGPTTNVDDQNQGHVVHLCIDCPGSEACPSPAESQFLSDVIVPMANDALKSVECQAPVVRACGVPSEPNLCCYLIQLSDACL
jgi:hypothetical protein